MGVEDLNYHIIGDIHGQGDKLERLLKRLGYLRQDGIYQQSGARVVFLGDFIDRGPQQRQVLEIVKPMVEAGHALAVMGNHEFNAIAYHTPHPETGEPLRPHTDKNTAQHRAFLREYRLHDEETREIIDWFRTLPLYLEVSDGKGGVLFRAVHACWQSPLIDRVPQYLDDEFLVQACTRGTRACEDIEVLLKGPEIELPDGHGFEDKDGNPRSSIRIRWWNRNPEANYRELAMAPENQLERIPLLPVEPARIEGYHYGPDEPPVFFGHYWLTGRPRPLEDNLACLDYSAGKGGKLVAYHWQVGKGAVLSEDRFVVA